MPWQASRSKKYNVQKRGEMSEKAEFPKGEKKVSCSRRGEREKEGRAAEIFPLMGAKILRPKDASLSLLRLLFQNRGGIGPGGSWEIS